MWALRTRAVRTQCASHYDAAVIEAWSGTPAPVSYLRLLEQGGGVLALADGVLAGYGVIDRESNEVDALFVDLAYGGRGIGRRLLGELERRAGGAGRLHLYASLNAVAFYRAAGYLPRREASYAHPCGISLACVFMERGDCQAPATGVS